MRNFILAIFISIGFAGFAQELNCSVVVNAQLTGNENFQIFKTLEKQLNEFVNKTQWTNKKFLPQELIQCSMVINVTGQSNDAFNASIQVQASRPIFGSSYTTPIYNVNDKDFAFRYVEFQNLNFNKTQYQSNLISVIAFHIYMILGVDADSFELKGGDSYFKQAQTIVGYSQQDNFKGWKIEDGQQSRFTLINNMLSQTFETFRKVNYSYHRKGLDIMHKNDKEAKNAIAKAISQMLVVHRQRPNSFLARTFFDAKADEIEQIFSGGPNIDVSEVVSTLNRVAPTYSSKWRNIKF